MTSFTPKVSILIPTYNQAHVVLQAVRSAQRQTYRNIEIIIGNDASNDGTADLLAASLDDRTCIVNNESNLGRTANYRNLLLKHSSGDYVVNLDGDDYYTDEKFIQKAVRAFYEHPDSVIVAARVVAKSSVEERVSLAPKLSSLDGSKVLRRLPNVRYHLMHMASVYVRKKATELEFYRFDGISSDWESLYRLALYGRVVYLDDVVGVWRLHESNESQSVNAVKHLENLNIWDSIFEEAVKRGMSPTLARLLSARCVAFFIIMSLNRLSNSSWQQQRWFFKKTMEKYKLAILFLFIKPTSLFRLALVFCRYINQRLDN